MSLTARSLLFVPGDRERFYEKAAGLAADAVIIDLEDAVLPEGRPAARQQARERLPGLGRPTWVRTNAVGTDDLQRDLEAVVDIPGLAGLVVPKVDGPEDVLTLDALLRETEQRAGVPEGSTRLIVMIESARGVVLAYPIAVANPRVVSLCFGGARGGDLHGDLGSGWSIDGPELLHARQTVLLAARAAGLSWPLDGVFADVADADGFAADTALSRRLGFRGRPVVHPSQIEPANAAYAPTASEIEAARGVIEAASRAAAAGEGTSVASGRLVDRAMVVHAEGVLEHARLVSPD